MRRRQVLALGASAVSFAGCSESDAESAVVTPTEEADRSATATTTRQIGATTTTPSIGGTLNGRPRRLGDNLSLIEKSNTTWIHAFFDVRAKYDQNVAPGDDPDVVALRRASREMKAKLFVSLQWDFAGLFGGKEPTNLPPPGSSRERNLIEYATELVTAVDQPVDLIGLGNEPVWETLDEDFRGPDAPLIPFIRELKDHLVTHYTRDDTRILVGAFNRLFNERIRRKYRGVYRRLLDLARNDDDIDGIDLHVHYDAFQQAETMFDVARQAFPHGTITATELSPMWRYNRYKDEPIAEFERGKQFADRYGVPEDTTVTEYFEAAKDDPLSHREMAEFMETMPWYNVDFVEDMYGLLNEYDVEVGTLGFLVDDGARNVDWTEGWAPFPINRLFQPVLIDTEDGAHPHYLDDFRNRA